MLTQKAEYSLLVLACCFAVPAAANNFIDNFEGASINSFWTASGPGTASLTTPAAHGGSQSVELAQPSAYAYVTLSHDFGIEQMGSVSVYLQRHDCCAGAALAITRANGDWANIQHLAAGGFYTRVFVDGVESGGPIDNSTSLDNWHLFDITTDLSGVTVKLDGTTVLTDPSIISFQFVSLEVWGSPAGSANFDDFNANTVAVPEPAAWTLMAICMGSLALIRRKR